MVVNATFLSITGGVFQRYYCEDDGLSSNDSCLLRLTAASPRYPIGDMPTCRILTLHLKKGNITYVSAPENRQGQSSCDH